MYFKFFYHFFILIKLFNINSFVDDNKGIENMSIKTGIAKRISNEISETLRFAEAAIEKEKNLLKSGKDDFDAVSAGKKYERGEPSSEDWIQTALTLSYALTSIAELSGVIDDLQFNNDAKEDEIRSLKKEK